MSDVWRLSVCLSVAYIGPKSRTERPRKTRIGTEVAHVTGDSDTTFKIKRSKVNLQGAYFGGLPHSLWLLGPSAAVRAVCTRTRKVLNNQHVYQPPKQTDVVVFYVSVATYFQFLLSVCFYTMPEPTSTSKFRIFDWKLSSKSKLSTYCQCEWIINLSTPGTTSI